MFCDAAHRSLTFSGMRPTNSQLRVIFLSLYVNLNRKSGSAQLSQLPQVTGQAAETPGRLQRAEVSVLATHSQDLVMTFPSLRTLSLRGLSLQTDGEGVGGIGVDTGEGGGVGTGVGIGVEGEVGTGDGIGVGGEVGIGVGGEVGIGDVGGVLPPV